MWCWWCYYCYCVVHYITENYDDAGRKEKEKEESLRTKNQLLWFSRGVCCVLKLYYLLLTIDVLAPAHFTPVFRVAAERNHDCLLLASQRLLKKSKTRKLSWVGNNQQKKFDNNMRDGKLVFINWAERAKLLTLMWKISWENLPDFSRILSHSMFLHTNHKEPSEHETALHYNRFFMHKKRNEKKKNQESFWTSSLPYPAYACIPKERRRERRVRKRESTRTKCWKKWKIKRFLRLMKIAFRRSTTLLGCN